MRAQHFKENIINFINSIAFPIILACLAFLCWMTHSLFVWVYFPIYFIFAFLPTLSEDGRGYLPLLFTLIIITNEDIHFSGGISLWMILGTITLTISFIVFLVVHKKKMQTGSVFYSLLFLFCTFLISYLKSTMLSSSTKQTGILYLLTFFLLLCIYALINTMIGQEETMPYFAKTYCCFACAAAMETSVILVFKNNLALASPSFSLGWSYTRETVSSFLCLSMPFFGMLIRDRKPFYAIPLFFVLINILFLSTDSGLLCLIIFTIPLVLFTLKDYSKYSSYFIMAVFLIIGSVFGILMGTNVEFNHRVTKALVKLNYFSSSYYDLLVNTWNNFIQEPILGQSISSIVNDDGTLSLASNTLLSTIIMGGSVSLFFYICYEVNLYRSYIKKKMKGKSLFLIFLIMIELIGLIDNTIYNIAILLVILLAEGVFRQTNRPDDVLVHEDYFDLQNEKADTFPSH